MLLADSASKVSMLFNGALIRLFWAGVAADLEFDYVDDVRITRFLIYQLPITNYQMAPSKRGAGGGSATHKEPT